MIVRKLLVGLVAGLKRIYLVPNKRLVFVYVETVKTIVFSQLANADQVELFVFVSKKKRLGGDLFESKPN